MVGLKVEGGEAAAANLNPHSFSLEKFILYETRSRFYLVGRGRSKTHWRVLKIDRSDPTNLSISEDPVIYTKDECKNLLQGVGGETRAAGKLNLVTKSYGIVGFIKFMDSYYMMLVTKRRQIGTLCGHAIYGIDENQLITVRHSSVQYDVAHSKAELRYKRLLSSVNLTKDFFFSHTYPLMQSLQKNALGVESKNIPYQNMFVWNAFLTGRIQEQLGNTQWTVALIHGYFEQAKLSMFGRVFTLTLIARRSRHFAGTRYLKRGVNDKGRVANDVETEQIVLDEDYQLKPGQMSSVVQYRGSIPLFWSQETSRLSPKPDIILQRFDPIYEATKSHFEDLSKRYGDPIIILNLIRTAEKRPREMILRREFANAVGYLNQVLPEEKRLKFIHWDFHKFAKSKSADVLGVLGAVASESLDLTGFYYSGKRLNAKQKLQQQRQASSSKDSHFGTAASSFLSNLGRKSPGLDYASSTSNTNSSRESVSEKESRRDQRQEKDHSKPPTYQSGVLRTNCIDCLDRTNIAQYAYGLASLGRQLHAMEFLEMPKIEQDSSVAAALMEMFKNMGDALALQYGGSTAHNMVFPERQGKWKATSQSQDLLKSIKRYYSNAYTDSEKQDAMNLFLGHFRPQEGKPALWELDSDYYLHVEGYRDESPVMGNMLSPKRSFSRAIIKVREKMIPLSRIPSYKDDFQRIKLTSFDKLLPVTCGTLKNVRTHIDLDAENATGGIRTGTTSDAAQILLKSPNWVYGHETSEDSVCDNLQIAPLQTKKDQTFDEKEFDWISPLDISSEVDMYDRYLMTASSENDNWYGTELLPGTIEGSEANQHYAKFCQVQVSDPFDSAWERDCNQYDASIEDAISFQDDNMKSAVEAILAEYKEIGVDLYALRPSFSYAKTIS